MGKDPEESGSVSSAEHTKKVPLCEGVLERMVIIGNGLEEAEEAIPIQFLRKNQDMFAWFSSDLRGASRAVIEHTLKVNPRAMPVK